MHLERTSPCKVNLLLNILGKRPDGFHELETIMIPVRLEDQLHLEISNPGITLTCSDPDLPTDARNLVFRAAQSFLHAANLPSGVRIHLEKHIPKAAGLGGGSGNAATTLLALNELFGSPLSQHALNTIATTLGSDVPFFLQNTPALASGRGEIIQPIPPFPALRHAQLLLVHPGFGIPTAWAYQALTRFPDALNGQPGRTQAFLKLAQHSDLAQFGTALYNALEIPAFDKYPYLALLKEFLLQQGAPAALMSGSGSTVFAILPENGDARALLDNVRSRFNPDWSAIVPL